MALEESEESERFKADMEIYLQNGNRPKKRKIRRPPSRKLPRLVGHTAANRLKINNGEAVERKSMKGKYLVGHIDSKTKVPTRVKVLELISLLIETDPRTLQTFILIGILQFSKSKQRSPRYRIQTSFSSNRSNQHFSTYIHDLCCITCW